jgi:hypothetical protein
MTTPAFMTKTAFAAHLGVGKSYISNLAKAGRLVVTPEGLVDVAASLALIKNTAGAPERAATAVVGEAFTDSAERRNYVLAEMAEMDLAERRGTLLQAADVRAFVVNAATTLRGRIESFPDLLAPQLSAISDETQIRNIMAAEIELLLSELSHQFGKLSQEPAHGRP